jgi:DNA-binding response OmpR family regulator/HPt (histidine-containing phosphotransfer) domain-containing protein
MRLLIIEDDSFTSSLLATTLSAHHHVVDVIADGAAGLELATQWNYDLILLDILLPSLNGIEVCRQLRNRGCQTPILVLTSQDSNQAVITGLDAGADDYVAKSCEQSQILARVRALLRRGSGPASAPMLTWEGLCLDPSLAQVTYSHKPVMLRPKEYSLLELFLRHPQRIHSRSSIIDHLWAMDEMPVEGSVTNLIKDLRQRLRSAGMKTDLIETVYGLGYRLRRQTKPESSPESSPEFSPETHPRPSRPGSRGGDPLQDSIDLTAIQQISERFRVSLNQRITSLELMVQSLKTSDWQQREAVRAEAHKLAGGLGTFGYERAAQTAQTIEHLLEAGSKVPSASQLSQLLKQLRQDLVLSCDGAKPWAGRMQQGQERGEKVMR